MGLAELYNEMFSIKLPKDQQQSDWGVPLLSPEQILYAGNDAIASARIGKDLVAFKEIDVMTWIDKAAVRFRKHLQKAPRQVTERTEKPSFVVTNEGLPRTSSNVSKKLSKELLPAYYQCHLVQNFSRGYAASQLNCSIASVENEDGTTSDVIVLPELPRRKNKTCRSQGKCKAKDFCPFDHENVEEQRQLYSAVAAAAASASHSGIQRMIQ